MRPSHPRRLRILHVLLLILITISVFPLWFFGTQMVQMNKDKLETQEKMLQTAISESLAQQVTLYVDNLREQVKELFDSVSPVAMATPESQFESSPQLLHALENLITDRPAVIYVTALNSKARGQSAQTTQKGGLNVASDTFVRRTLEAAYLAAEQGQTYESNPITVGTQVSQPVIVMARPIFHDKQFGGMVAAVATLEPIVKDLKETKTLLLDAYVVNSTGRIVASNNADKNIAGLDMNSVPIVQTFLSMGGRAHLTETSEFTMMAGSKPIDMVGTYSPALDGQWGVIVQIKKSDAFATANEMRKATILLGLVVIVISLIVAFLSAKSITRPIEELLVSARQIAGRNFSVHADVHSRTEIGELAEGFNRMAYEIQEYVEHLKEASEQNRQLFVDSIDMIAAAVDAKDPYTKGHSGRVAQYSIVVARELGLEESEVEKVRLSATLHDVGKIGIDDRVLKKPGVLTNEEFEHMKRHTVMGFEIVRQVKQLAEMLPGIRWHHEALNGQGYPDGLKGDELPLIVRIIAVADTFDAITTDRPYQAGRDFPSALGILRKAAGTKYDPIAVDALCAAYEKGALRKQEQRRSSQISVQPA